tara:strand:+ start:5096 stop:5479 length:384 start_codon:yes stop_codon:yes gene_type:complete
MNCAVADALYDIDVPPRRESMCLELAARLYAEGWFDHPTTSNPTGLVFEQEVIDLQTRAAFKKGIVCGIIPGGLLGMVLWFVARQIAWHFLSKLIRNWWLAERATTECLLAEHQSESDPEHPPYPDS